MTPLRQRMTEDLQLHGYSLNTQLAYLGAVHQLAAYYHKSPAVLTEADLRAYFLSLTQEQHCASGTFKIALSGIKFLFTQTLHQSWPIFELASAPAQKKLPVVLSRPEVRLLLGSVRAPVYRICLSTIYSCGLRISEGIGLQVGDVDGERKLLRVRGKGNKERLVPLAEPTLETLRTFWKTHRTRPWLFPAHLQPRAWLPLESGPIAVGNLRRAFHVARLRSGVTKMVCVHSLRYVST